MNTGIPAALFPPSYLDGIVLAVKDELNDIPALVSWTAVSRARRCELAGMPDDSLVPAVFVSAGTKKVEFTPGCGDITSHVPSTAI